MKNKSWFPAAVLPAGLAAPALAQVGTKIAVLNPQRAFEISEEGKRVAPRLAGREASTQNI